MVLPVHEGPRRRWERSMRWEDRMHCCGRRRPSCCACSSCRVARKRAVPPSAPRTPQPAPRQVLSPAVEKKPPPVSGKDENADQLYKKALSVYQNGNYGEAATLFSSITENYPDHNLAVNALYWSGECFYAQKNHKGAIRAFKRVLEKYPGGSKVPDSLLKIGYSYLALGDKTNAQSFLKKVVKQYPFTPAGSKAGEMLKRIKSK